MTLEQFYSMKYQKNIYNPLSDELKAIINRKPVISSPAYNFHLRLEMSPRGIRSKSENRPAEYLKKNAHHILDQILFTSHNMFAPSFLCDVYRDEHAFLHTILARARTEADYYYYEDIIKTLYPMINLPIAKIYIERIKLL